MPLPVPILHLYFDCVECKKRFDAIDSCYAHEKTHSASRSVETMTDYGSPTEIESELTFPEEEIESQMSRVIEGSFFSFTKFRLKQREIGK